MSYNSFARRFNSTNLTLQQWLIASCGFSLLLVMVRMLSTSTATYWFLAGNLVLAFIPFAISEWLYNRIYVLERRMAVIFILVIWLMFIPNSFYIITDLFHLHEVDPVPKWFDLLLIFSFAWNGLLLGVLSVRKIEIIAEVLSGRRSSVVLVFAVMWLNAFGIYIGRYMRFNSWDVITRPFSLFTELITIIIHPLQNRMEWGMVFGYALFMTVLYFTLKRAGEQFNHSIKYK